MSAPGILQRLRADHRRVLRDLDLVDRALHPPGSRRRGQDPLVTMRRVLGRLARQFDTHMAAEDERLFPACIAALPEARPGLETLDAEHTELRGLLAQLGAQFRLPPDSRRDEAIRVQWSDFSELLRIHIRKEESVVFHVAERVVPAEEWQRIAARRFPPAIRRRVESRPKPKGASSMKRIVPLVIVVLLAGSTASCGGRGAGGDGAGSSTPAASTGSSASGASSGPTAVAAVSQYDAGPRAGETPRNDEQAENGEKLFTSKGCSACHAFGKRLTCPDLQGVSMRRTAMWMENQILHPDVMVKTDPISHGLFAQFALQMPNQGLTPEEARAVIEYFKHKDHEAGLTPGGR